MRPIEYRAYDKITKEMCPVWVIHWKAWDEPVTINFVTIEIDGTIDRMEHEVELMQWTGLFDKNGLKIFESDIVKFEEHDGEEPTIHIGIIEWHNDSACFFIHWQDDAIQMMDECEIKIIGNCFEHNELLETEK